MAKLTIKRIISSHKLRPILWLGIVILALLIAVVASRQASAPSSVVPVDGSTVSLTGEFTCLPHKDTSGPQTMECAFGLKAGDTYYALGDSTSDYSLLSKLVTGQTVSVTGTFKANPSSNYQDIGTVTVTSID